MKKRLMTGLCVGAALMAAATASAHVSIGSGPAVADAGQEVTFNVGHGCSLPGGGSADTVKLVIDIPPGVGSVRPLPNPFGKATVTGNPVTQVTYEKAPADELDDDTQYYKLTIRLRPPNAPFTKLYFKVHQYCKGVAEPSEWIATPDAPDGGAGPAAELVVLPPRLPGWNKYTVPVSIPDLSVFFKDAAIVWKGNAAYSANPHTASQIASEPGVVALTALEANDEIWVKY
jgi:hypothetical protein